MTHHDNHHHDRDGLTGKLRALSWLLLRRERMRGRPIADPTRGQGRILAMLKIRDGIATKELSYLLGIRTSSLNEALAKMERAGLITREPSPEDGRIMLVTLTEEGAATDQVEPEATGLFASFTEEEKQQFGDYLDRLIAAIEQEQGVAGPDRMRDGRRMREYIEGAGRHQGRRGGRGGRGPWEGGRGGWQPTDDEDERRGWDRRGRMYDASRSGGPAGPRARYRRRTLALVSLS